MEFRIEEAKNDRFQFVLYYYSALIPSLLLSHYLNTIEIFKYFINNFINTFQNESFLNFLIIVKYFC